MSRLLWHGTPLWLLVHQRKLLCQLHTSCGETLFIYWQTWLISTFSSDCSIRSAMTYILVSEKTWDHFISSKLLLYPHWHVFVVYVHYDMFMYIMIISGEWLWREAWSDRLCCRLDNFLVRFRDFLEVVLLATFIGKEAILGSVFQLDHV